MTFSHWLKKFGARIGKAALSCSLLMAGLAWAADYEAVSERLGQASNEAAKVKVLRELYGDPSIDPDLREALADLVNGESYAITIPQAEAMVELRAFAQRSAKTPAPKDAAKAAQEIKRNPLYRDPGDKEQSNWFAKGFEHIGELMRQWLEALLNRGSNDPVDMPSSLPQVGWVRYLLWAVFGALVLAFIYFAARHFSWKKGLDRKATAMLGEEEPELSRDEYLAEADRLIAEGKHRLAVRYLYLACLLLFDENGVARFVRGQTNWEHLRRIQSSGKLPSDLDFEPATRKFDTVWYGMRVEGEVDVDAMRAWYVQVADRLRRSAA